jgi:polar amino acid transport system permease protein
MVYPAQIFLFVGFIYLVLCTALDRVATYALTRRKRIVRPLAPAAAEALSGD